VVVALVAALRAAAGTVPDSYEVAAEAHRIETEGLGLQSGVQDQIAAAHGGANLIDIGPYPAAEVHPLQLSDDTWEALAHRLVTVYLGVPHRSSSVHEAVIARLAGSDGDALLEPLRSAAHQAAEALMAGDIDAYGHAMIRNTGAQARLYPGLVGDDARAVIQRASSLGAAGWKVNGAGGDGGSVTIVCPEDPARLLAALSSMSGVTPLTLRPTRDGVRVVDRD
jgi:D-glycero-alpha-D-manno-heptose-7-phosphate kinase